MTTEYPPSRSSPRAKVAPEEAGLLDPSDATASNTPLLRSLMPFIAHFVLNTVVTAFALMYINGRVFNLTSRRPDITEPNGSVYRSSRYTPLQSDITTAFSYAATAARSMAGWWGAEMAWRCVFILMKRGVSLRGVKGVLHYWPPLRPCHVGQKGALIKVYIILSTTTLLQYSSPILAGSVTWSQASNFVPSSELLDGISVVASGSPFMNWTGFLPVLLARGTSTGDLAWGLPTGNATVMRRVLPNNPYLSVNSTLKNITVPWFAIDQFEWIVDTNFTLTSQQQNFLYDYGSQSPYFDSRGNMGLIPDNEWGLPSNNTIPDPHTVWETRILSIRTIRRTGETTCNYSSSSFGEIPGTIRLFAINPGDNYVDCFIMARVTYKAGAAICENCRLAAPNIIQNDTILLLRPDELTSAALGLAPVLGTYMVIGNYSTPPSFGNLDNYATEMLSQSYQSAWTTLLDMNSISGGLLTDVNISVPASQASIQQWRVFIWLALNTTVLLLGLLFFLTERSSWLGDPLLAALLLNTRDVGEMREVEWHLLPDNKFLKFKRQKRNKG